MNTCKQTLAKGIKLLSLVPCILFVIASICSCSDDDISYTPIDMSGNSNVVNLYTYTQDCSLDGKDTSGEVILKNVDGKIAGISCNADWLKCTDISKYDYILKLLLETTPNTTGAERSALVTVTTVKGDKVLLTVTQEKTETVDSNDEMSDQPAYIPAK